MSKPIKLSDRNKQWYRKEKTPGRPKASRSIRQRILIVCEGTKTEPYYFESISKLLPPRLVSLQIFGEGASTLSLVERTRDLRDKRARGDFAFDKVWIVFDRDNFPLDAFDNASCSAEADGMNCAWSNEAFEFWYVLHFEYRDTATSRDDFERIISRYFNERYQKTSPTMYDKLTLFGNQSQAIAWARRLDEGFKVQQIPPSRANPSTTVYKLVEELNRYLPAATV